MFRLSQIDAQNDDPVDTPLNAVQQWKEQAFMLSRPKTKKFTAEICGVSQELQKHGHRTLLHIDLQAHRPKVSLVNAGDQELMEQDERREALYPFGDEEVTEVNAIKRRP